jgi:hypothetical protein
LLLVIVGYAADLDYSQMRFFVETSSDTIIADWNNYFRGICSDECLHFSFDAIGGEGTTVEIDESLVFKCKNHIGRYLYAKREHIWVLGGVCRETRSAFAVAVTNRTAATLETHILRHVSLGTRIITDGWAGYSNLRRSGYTHIVVNHSQNFVDPEDNTVFTNMIERHWGILKQIIPKQTHGDLRYSYLAEYIWKMKTRWYSLSIGERIE